MSSDTTKKNQIFKNLVSNVEGIIKREKVDIDDKFLQAKWHGELDVSSTSLFIFFYVEREEITLVALQKNFILLFILTMWTIYATITVLVRIFRLLLFFFVTHQDVQWNHQ